MYFQFYKIIGTLIVIVAKKDYEHGRRVLKISLTDIRGKNISRNIVAVESTQFSLLRVHFEWKPSPSRRVLKP